MPYVHVGRRRRRLFYRHFGDPHAPIRVLFTTGLGGDHSHWEPQTVHFERWPECQFVLYDNRGVGRSHAAGGLWTTAGMASDAIDLLDALGWAGPRSVHIVGLSMGGMVSLELALKDTQRFASLSLLATSAGGPLALALFAAKLPTGLALLARVFTSSSPQKSLGHALQLLYPEEALRRPVFDPASGKEVASSDVLARALVQRGAANRRDRVPVPAAGNLARQALAVATHRVGRQRLQRLAEHFGDAVVVVTGDSDILVDKRNSRALAEGLRAELVEIPCAGHGVAEQCAAVVNDVLMRNMRRGVARAEQLAQRTPGSQRPTLQHPKLELLPAKL